MSEVLTAGEEALMSARNRDRPGAPEVRTAEVEQLLAAARVELGVGPVGDMPSGLMTEEGGEVSASAASEGVMAHHNSGAGMPPSDMAGTAATEMSTTSGFGGVGAMPQGNMRRDERMSGMPDAGSIVPATDGHASNGAAAGEFGAPVIDMPGLAMGETGQDGTAPSPGMPGDAPMAGGVAMPDAAGSSAQTGQAINLSGTWKLTISIGGDA